MNADFEIAEIKDKFNIAAEKAQNKQELRQLYETAATNALNALGQIDGAMVQ